MEWLKKIKVPIWIALWIATLAAQFFIYKNNVEDKIKELEIIKAELADTKKTIIVIDKNVSDINGQLRVIITVLKP